MYFIPCFRVSQDALRKIACSCLVSSPDVPIGTICPSSVANKPQDSADSSECLQVLFIWGKGPELRGRTLRHWVLLHHETAELV